SSFFSFLDYKISKNLIINDSEDNLKTSNLPSTEEIINKILAINEVGAATVNYKAVSLIPSSKISLDGKPGDVITYSLKFKNTGTYVWRKAGTNQMVLRVKGNKSGFLKSDKWISSSVVANLTEDVVNVGKTGEYKITLKFPEKTTTETYVMHVKSYDQEVSGSEIQITLNVNNSVSSATTTTTVVNTNTNTNNILTKSYKLYDQSPEIKKLQQFLNDNGFTIAQSGIGSKGRETEYFGPATVKALTVFQNKYNLKNAGTLTDETIKFINSFTSKSSSNNSNVTNITAQSEKDEELSLDNISYISSDKKFDIVDSITSNVVLSVDSGEKVNISFNQVTKTYTVSKNGLIYYSSKNKVNVKNTGSGNIDFGGKKYSTSLIALKSDFDIKTNTSNGTVVCASVDCNLVDNNTNVNVVDNSTNNTPTNTSSVTTSTGSVISYLNHQYIKNEFKIRVGISYNLLPATITNTQSYNIVDGDNLLVTQVNAGEQVVIDYNNNTKIYSVIKNNVVIKETVSYLKLQNNNNGVFTINNMTLSPYGVNYNMFRGDLELRYNSTYDHAWIINELNMEDYLKGIGEASNSSSYEYLKVMAVTARTYATYHYLNDSKNAAQYFNVFSTTSDQVYYGYRREISQPNVVRAVDETRGMYITYNDKIIQAFYSANAGGKTRTLSETWGGTDLPYLQPVVDKYTINDTRFGH
ncbi:MAG: SpoIID/LytB domain-containing protein, partial [Patescibacteria group bacterium]